MERPSQETVRGTGNAEQERGSQACARRGERDQDAEQERGSRPSSGERRYSSPARRRPRSLQGSAGRIWLRQKSRFTEARLSAVVGTTDERSADDTTVCGERAQEQGAEGAAGGNESALFSSPRGAVFANLQSCGTSGCLSGIRFSDKTGFVRAMIVFYAINVSNLSSTRNVIVGYASTQNAMATNLVPLSKR